MKNENSVMAILAAAVGALCSYAAALGGPVPGFLQKLLGRLKDTVEKKAEGESDADHRDNV